MVHSKLFNYIRNQYILGNFTAEEMNKLVSLGRITEDERKEIMGEV